MCAPWARLTVILAHCCSEGAECLQLPLGEWFSTFHIKRQRWLKLHSVWSDYCCWVKRRKGAVYVCQSASAWFFFFSGGCLFFACAHFPLPSYVETMQDTGSLFLILTRYWFIIFDSCDICSFNSPLRASFQSLLEVEAEKNNTERMISGFNFNGNCQLFPYSIIFLGNNSWVPSFRRKLSANKQNIKFVFMWWGGIY